MNYTDWESQVVENIKNDVLWKMEVYRLSLFSADIGWFDVTKLAKDTRTQKLSDQLYRALGSISANIAEGYSRNSSKDQARFYENHQASTHNYSKHPQKLSQRISIRLSSFGTTWYFRKRSHLIVARHTLLTNFITQHALRTTFKAATPTNPSKSAPAIFPD